MSLRGWVALGGPGWPRVAPGGPGCPGWPWVSWVALGVLGGPGWPGWPRVALGLGGPGWPWVSWVALGVLGGPGWPGWPRVALGLGVPGCPGRPWVSPGVPGCPVRATCLTCDSMALLLQMDVWTVLRGRHLVDKVLSQQGHLLAKVDNSKQNRSSSSRSRSSSSSRNWTLLAKRYMTISLGNYRANAKWKSLALYVT